MTRRPLLIGALALALSAATWAIAAATSRDAAAPAAPAPAPTRIARVVARPAPASRPSARPAPAPSPAGYVIHRILPIEGPMKFGQAVWDDAGVPDGEVVITVDLKAQTLSVFRAGYEIGAAVVLFGADEYPTPLGVFPITQKDADHVSNLYDAPMPYMLRMTNDGISIHGATVEPGAVTHGCIGIPTSFAKKLFAVAKLGTKVIVTRGEMLDVGGAITAR